ncbi:Transcriptional activator protein DAL81 [Lasiodiplodia hormozganensis]|uniref:Transcriptional activator protein DAL81 n=1 Tax=Lasiodiplodia hormozganensis TaxID=869390 RepID=A0AA39YZN2_9PEZI|nr:Transcriptional activator protein DAL81 [Lasiodiplodia hormozganensis]
MPRSDLVPLAAARPKSAKPMPGKENLFSHKPNAQPGQLTPAQRSRRERPCDACRRRKSRCVIHEGALLCVLCEFHKQECTFVQSPLPRKRKINVDGQKEESAKKRSVEREQPQSTTVPLQQPSPTTKFSRRAPHLADTTGQALQETLGLQRRQHSRYIGPTTPFDPLLISLTQFDTRNESTFDLGVLRKVHDNEHFIMLPDENTQDFDSEIEALNAVEAVVAPHGSQLIDVYFRSVHPNFPIIQKTLFMQRHRDADRQISPPLLAGIYMLALQWWSYEPRLASLPKPDVSKLEAIASHWLPKAMERPKLSTIQAGLLLLQRPDSDSWSLTTQLVAIAQELGLHLDCSNWSIPLWEKGLRKRIAWALYMQDKWSSLIHGRPSHIYNADWAVKPISDEDFYEDGAQTGEVLRAGSEEEAADEERGAYVFAQMITLTAIMAEVMDTFYTQTAIQDFQNAGKNSTRLILDRAKPVQIKLKEWFARLPASTRIDSHNSGRSSNTATGALHLAYFATEITLHRRIVQSLDPETSDPYLLFICRSAAKTRLISAMDFVNRLTPAHLQSFWYFASKINFTLIGTFGSLLWATAPGREEAEFYKTRLREYRWTLSVSATRARWLEYAVQMLDASREMLRGMKEKPPLAETIAAQQQQQQQQQSLAQQQQPQQLVVSDSGVPSMKPGGSALRQGLSVQFLHSGSGQHYGSEPSVSFEGYGPGDDMGEEYEGSIGDGDFDERMSEGSDKGGLKTPVSAA